MPMFGKVSDGEKIINEIKKANDSHSGVLRSKHFTGIKEPGYIFSVEIPYETDISYPWVNTRQRIKLYITSSEEVPNYGYKAYCIAEVGGSGDHHSFYSEFKDDESIFSEKHIGNWQYYGYVHLPDFKVLNEYPSSDRRDEQYPYSREENWDKMRDFIERVKNELVRKHPYWQIFLTKQQNEKTNFHCNFSAALKKVVYPCHNEWRNYWKQEFQESQEKLYIPEAKCHLHEDFGYINYKGPKYLTIWYRGTDEIIITHKFDVAQTEIKSPSGWSLPQYVVSKGQFVLLDLKPSRKWKHITWESDSFVKKAKQLKTPSYGSWNGAINDNGRYIWNCYFHHSLPVN